MKSREVRVEGRFGIESLTADERGVLQRATDERRGRERRNG